MKKVYLALTLLAFLVVLPTYSRADSCGGDTPLWSGNNVEGCVSFGTNSVTLDSVWLNGVQQADNSLKIDSILWMGDATISTAGFSASSIPQVWGAYDNGAKDPGGAPGPPFTFNFDSDPGTDITIHVGSFPSGCSAWVSTRWQGQAGPGSNDCGGGEVPEPATLTLLGTGLLGVAGAIRRRMRKF